MIYDDRNSNSQDIVDIVVFLLFQLLYVCAEHKMQVDIAKRFKSWWMSIEHIVCWTVSVADDIDCLVTRNGVKFFFTPIESW